MVAFPAVLNPAILSPNTTDISATSSQASWIASMTGISGIAGFIIFSPIFQCYGRRAVNIGLNIVMFIGWITLSMANSVTMLLMARAIQGLSIGGVFICPISLSEYVSARRRGYFMAIKKVSIGLGSLTCHSLAFICTWRQISCFCVVPVVMSIILILFWPESPAYLAMKGRFDECEKAFLWLNGDSAESKMELKELMTAQMKKYEDKEINTPYIKRFVKILKNREMMKTCLIVALVFLCIDACGRYFLPAYITQILKEITGSQSLAMYCSIVSDLLLVSALTLSCLVIRIFKRRTLLFGFGSVAVLFMFVISILLGISNSVFLVSWLIPGLILLHSFIANIGMVPVAFAISSEVFPLEYKGLCSIISGIAFTIFYAATLKLTPIMMEYTGVSGTYAIYGLIVAFCLASLSVILPETKDKTLQEIENEIKGIEKSDVNDGLISENDTFTNA